MSSYILFNVFYKSNNQLFGSNKKADQSHRVTQSLSSTMTATFNLFHMIYSLFTTQSTKILQHTKKIPI